MAQTWIVVADSARARIFSADKPRGEILEIETLAHPQGRLHERDLTSDAPGRSFDSSGDGRHAMEPATSARRAEALAFAREVAGRLEAGRTGNLYNRLMLVAPPTFLGLLRDSLSHETARRVVRELHKNLAQLNGTELRRHLPEQLWTMQDEAG